jgi:hypothetical protein
LTAAFYHSIIAFQTTNTDCNVNTVKKSEPGNTHTDFRRVLAFLLVGLILFGTTIQAAHRHGTAVAGDDSPASVSLATSKPGQNSSTTIIDCGDCLICQLQQSFSAALITHRGFDSPDLQIVLFSLSGPHNFLSTVSPTQTGRAPPFTS